MELLENFLRMRCRGSGSVLLLKLFFRTMIVKHNAFERERIGESLIRLSFVEIQFPFFVLITTSGAGLGEEQHVPSDLIFFLMA